MFFLKEIQCYSRVQHMHSNKNIHLYGGGKFLGLLKRSQSNLKLLSIKILMPWPAVSPILCIDSYLQVCVCRGMVGRSIIPPRQQTTGIDSANLNAVRPTKLIIIAPVVYNLLAHLIKCSQQCRIAGSSFHFPQEVTGIHRKEIINCPSKCQFLISFPVTQPLTIHPC